jgi:hypothetical protein
MADANPPIKSQMALSVGAPVKNRETSDQNDSEALIPMIVMTIPTTNNAIPTALFMSFPSLLLCGCPSDNVRRGIIVSNLKLCADQQSAR